MNNPYYTHRPYLQKILNDLSRQKSTQPIYILELGVGDGSSELMNIFAKNMPNASILGIETDPVWAETMRHKSSLPNYTINTINSWNIDIYQNLDQPLYDLVFIDQTPWSARIEALDYLYRTDSFITAILHDYDYYNPKDRPYDIGVNSFFSKYLDKCILLEHHEILPPTLIFSHE